MAGKQGNFHQMTRVVGSAEDAKKVDAELSEYISDGWTVIGNHLVSASPQQYTVLYLLAKYPVK